jgi:predicted dehydrogenase
MEFASGTLGVVIGSDCRGSARIPWGGMGLFGTHGSLEITEVHNPSGYPTCFEVNGRPHATELTAQSYFRGEHLALEEPHLYADVMDLADAILEDRAPRAPGEQARHVVEIIEKAQAAARTGQAQTLESTFSPPSP